MNPGTDRDSPAVELMDADGTYYDDDICSLCRVDLTLLEALIEHGVLEPELVGTRRTYRQVHVVRISQATRVQRDFDVSIDHLALVTDLLDTIKSQRQELQFLRSAALTRR